MLTPMASIHGTLLCRFPADNAVAVPKVGRDGHAPLFFSPCSSPFPPHPHTGSRTDNNRAVRLVYNTFVLPLAYVFYRPTSNRWCFGRGVVVRAHWQQSIPPAGDAYIHCYGGERTHAVYNPSGSFAWRRCGTDGLPTHTPTPPPPHTPHTTPPPFYPHTRAHTRATYTTLRRPDLLRWTPLCNPVRLTLRRSP